MSIFSRQNGQGLKRPLPGPPLPRGPRLRSLVGVPPRCFATCTPAYSLLRGQKGMSSSDPPAATGACAKSAVSAGTSLCGVKRPPFSPPSREPRNWTESAMISIDCRLLPSFDGDRASLREVLGAVLTLSTPNGDVEVVGLVDPFACGLVLAPRVARDPHAAN